MNTLYNFSFKSVFKVLCNYPYSPATSKVIWSMMESAIAVTGQMSGAEMSYRKKTNSLSYGFKIDDNSQVKAQLVIKFE